MSFSVITCSPQRNKSMKKKVTNSEVSKEYIAMLKEKFAEKKQLQDATEVGGVHNCWKLTVVKPARQFL